MTVEEKIDDILEETEVLGEMLEKMMGKKNPLKPILM